MKVYAHDFYFAFRDLETGRPTLGKQYKSHGNNAQNLAYYLDYIVECRHSYSGQAHSEVERLAFPALSVVRTNMKKLTLVTWTIYYFNLVRETLTKSYKWRLHSGINWILVDIYKQVSIGGVLDSPPSGEGFISLVYFCNHYTSQDLPRKCIPFSPSFFSSPSHSLSNTDCVIYHDISETNEEEGEEAEALVINVGEADGDVKFRIRNLTKRSESNGGGGAVMILNKQSLDIPKVVIVGIIGPSGSGKSTLLRALNRLWEPPAGTVFLGGHHDICDLDVVTLRRKVVVYAQSDSDGRGTVAENIRYGPQLSGKKLIDQDVCKLLTLAGPDPSFFNKNGSELSVGQAQRVALARTLANSPELLLLDEPTSALDPISTEHIEGVLEKLKKKQGMTIIMVSHSIKQIQRIVDVVCLVNGEIVEVLKPNKFSEAKHPMALRFLEFSS